MGTSNVTDHLIMKGAIHPWIPLNARSHRAIPKNEITRLAGSEFHWEATGNDPFFVVNMKKKGKPGWYKLQAQILAEENLASAESKLYIDYGEGFSEYHSLTLPKSKDDDSFSVILKFDRKPTFLRLDPLDIPGKFSINEFSLTPLSSIQACYSMMKSVSSHGHPAVGKNIARLRKKGAEGMLKNLYKDYKKTCLSKVEQNNYEAWINRHDHLSESWIENLCETMEKVEYQPLISIVMPVYNSTESFLSQAIESIQKQAYKNWELCIADDASTYANIKKILEQYKNKDARIKVTYRSNNGHISKASNSALNLATGEWITFMDHDDIMRPHALAMMVLEMNKHQQAKLIYSDEDKITEEGQRYDPHFKPDWNPELFLSLNYLNHLTAIKADLVHKVKGFRPGLEGSQDYDLLLRVLDFIEPKHIQHIPRILYHWRATVGSTAADIGEKSYTTDAGKKALADYISRNSLPATIEDGPFPTSYRVKHSLSHHQPRVSLIIPTRNGGSMLKCCIESIYQKTHYNNFEIIVVDNQSDDQETLSYLKKMDTDGKIRLLKYDHEFNYSAINNYAVSQCTSDFIGLINDDIEVIEPDWLSEMVSHAQRESVGAVGAKLLYTDGRIQHGGVITGIGGVAGHAHKYFPGDSAGYFGRAVLTQSVSAVTAACLIVQREIYNNCEGLNATNLKVAFNDVDFCLRLQKKGYRNIWTPHARLYHHESASRGTEDTPEKQSRFLSEVIYMQNSWGKQLTEDPAYNPNLTMDSEDFSLAEPPRLTATSDLLSFWKTNHEQ